MSVKTTTGSSLFARNMKEHSYNEVWREIAGLLKHNTGASILIVNCGVGYFVKYLLDKGFSNVFGIDTHLELIQKGIELCPELAEKIVAANFFRLSKADQACYDIYVFLKTLEYQENGDRFLEAVPIGARIIAAYPNYDDGLVLKSFSSKADLTEYAEPFMRSTFVHSVSLFKNAEFMIDQAVLLVVGERRPQFRPGSV